MTDEDPVEYLEILFAKSTDEDATEEQIKESLVKAAQELIATISRQGDNLTINDEDDEAWEKILYIETLLVKLTKGIESQQNSYVAVLYGDNLRGDLKRHPLR